MVGGNEVVLFNSLSREIREEGEGVRVWGVRREREGDRERERRRGRGRRGRKVKQRESSV